MNPLAKLRWQCRRGALELDLMLKRYLDTEYLQADDEEKMRFAELLKWEDDELLEILLGGKEPSVLGYGSLVEKIRRIS